MQIDQRKDLGMAILGGFLEPYSSEFQALCLGILSRLYPELGLQIQNQPI